MFNTRRVFITGAAASLIEVSDAAAQCRPGDVLVGETETEYICRRAGPQDLPRCGEMPATPEGIQRFREGLRRELAANGQAARRSQAALDEWCALLSDDTRDQARKERIGIGTDLVLGATLDRAIAAGTAHRIFTVQQAGLYRREAEAVFARLRSMSPSVKTTLLARISRATTIEQGLIHLREGQTAIDADYNLGRLAIARAWRERAEATVGLLQIARNIAAPNPAITLLIADLQLLGNALYGWWSVLAARNRLSQFIALEDARLEAVIRQSNRYVLATNSLAASRRGQTACLAAP